MRLLKSSALVLTAVVAASMLLVAPLVACGPSHQSAEEAAFQKELPDATPVQIGVLTEKQRIHSKLYTDYQLMRRGQGSIIDMVADQAKGKIIGTTVLPGLGPLLNI